MCYMSMDSSQQALQNIKKLFFKFRIRFRIIGRKPKNIQKNSDPKILIKVQCVIYQWIRLDKHRFNMHFLHPGMHIAIDS